MSLLPVLAALLLLPGPSGDPAAGSVYWERGHYWIEVVFADGDRSALSADPDAWLVTDLDGGDRFHPSRVRLTGAERLRAVLSSGRIRGRRCYEVAVLGAGGDTLRAGPFCDPFREPDEDGGCAPRRWFRRWVAPVFSRRGEPWRVDELACRYEFAGERRTVDLNIRPRIETEWWAIEGGVSWDATSWEKENGRRPVDRRSADVSFEGRKRAGPFGLAVEASFRGERALSVPADSVRRGRVLRGMLRVRLDRLFAGANRWCVSTFKGVDLSFGYARFREERGSGETAGSWEWTPVARGSLVWTVLYGFQFAYRIESYWPSSAGERFREYHRLRFRLLLRDALDRPSGSPWHPDLELAIDDGRRPPFFERERRVSVGFVFDLFPF